MSLQSETSAKQPTDQPRAVAVGAFDGVHLGHATVVQAVLRAAERLGVTSAALTFEPTPRQYFGENGGQGQRLTPDPERLQLLCNLGVEQVLVQTFDDALRQMQPQEFAQRILVEELQARFVVIGDSHSFGAGRDAGPRRMVELGQDLGFEVQIIPLAAVAGQAASSTAIRQALARGEVQIARSMLGRPYSLSGKVVHGLGIGSGLGSPTANLELPTAKLVPADGVYAAMVVTAGPDTQPAALVIGPAPTLGIAERRIEVHLIDFEGDLYGSELTVALLQRLRPIQKFARTVELADQIEQDISATRRLYRQEMLKTD